MAHSINYITDSCYEGTICLINKFDNHDENLLAKTESAIILAKASLLDQQPFSGKYDFTQWIRHLGYDIDLSVADIDLFMVATIHAAQGIMDDLISFFDTMLIDPNLNLDLHLSL